MSKKENFSQAAYEMFGIGKGGSKHEAGKPAEKPAALPLGVPQNVLRQRLRLRK